MSDESDFYQILGVHPKASSGEIKEAFRRLAQKYHPDRGSLDVETVELFKRITEAYQTLMNSESRNEYNKEHGYQFHEEVSVGGVTASSEYAASGDATAATPSNVDLSGVERDWSSLHKMAKSGNDLNMHQKIAAHNPEEDEETEDDDAAAVSAWGELDAAPVSGGILSNLLSGRRKDKNFQNRGVLKKNLKRTMQEESIPKRPSHITDTSQLGAEAQRPHSQEHSPRRDESPRISDPLRDERIYKFQITALEAAFGTSRQLVLSHGGDDRISKIDVEIPAGISNGTVLEVARGWERANVEVRVIQDTRFEVRGMDIRLRAPVTLKEALDGARITVPGLRETRELTLLSGRHATDAQRIEGAGIGVEGVLEVQPYIVAPSQHSATLVAAAQVVDAHYEKSDVREGFLRDPLSPHYCYETEQQITLYPPMLFGELVRGTTISVSLRGTTVEVVIPENWNHKKGIEIRSALSTLGKMLVVEPYAVLPTRSSAELQAAALAIEQHFLDGVRSHLPRHLLPR